MSATILLINLKSVKIYKMVGSSPVSHDDRSLSSFFYHAIGKLSLGFACLVQQNKTCESTTIYAIICIFSLFLFTPGNVICQLPSDSESSHMCSISEGVGSFLNSDSKTFFCSPDTDKFFAYAVLKEAHRVLLGLAFQSRRYQKVTIFT